MADKSDLLAYAKEAATSKTDLYELLGVEPATSKEDVHRAWRRRGLKYHPDKARDGYDAAKYELFTRARDVLADAAAREAYDGARAAAQLRARQTELMSADRRRFKDELERAESAAAATQRQQQQQQQQPHDDEEREVLREAGRRRVEERRRLAREAEDRDRRREDERIAEIERRLREKQDKARRRAERRAREAPAAAAAAASSSVAEPATRAEEEEGTAVDGEWRKLVGAGDGDVPLEKRPIYAYTIKRLKAAAAQRRDRLRAQGVAVPAPLSPQWDEVGDPEVRSFIPRVPRLGARKMGMGEDIDMVEA